MQTPSFIEDHISQIPALQLLQNLGYTYLTPKEVLKERQDKLSNVILEDILEQQLMKINEINFKGKIYPFYNIVKPTLKIRKLTKRWGSYNKNSNTITMNIETIKANKDCIDYVIYHELCHCLYFSHNKQFYTLLESKCKEWSKLKNKLEKLTL